MLCSSVLTHGQLAFGVSTPRPWTQPRPSGLQVLALSTDEQFKDHQYRHEQRPNDVMPHGHKTRPWIPKYPDQEQAYE